MYRLVAPFCTHADVAPGCLEPESSLPLYSPSFRQEFFSETDLRGLRSSARGASMRYVGSVLWSVLAGVAFVGPTATYILLAQ